MLSKSKLQSCTHENSSDLDSFYFRLVTNWKR